MRPALLVLVAGTGTDIGKTWVARRLVADLRRGGLAVSARKPAQSFAAGDRITDADLLAEASGEAPEVVCPPHRWYPVAMAPPMAAAAIGRPVPTLAELVGEVDRSWPNPGPDVGIVEGAGGVASPLAADGDTADLGRRLGADVAVLVADAGLGTINAVRLSSSVLAGAGDVAVHLNRYDPGRPLHQANRDWLAGVDGLTVTTDIEALVASLWRRVTGGRAAPDDRR